MADTEQEVAPSYTASPNQIVYDTPHVVDHEVNVLDIYFSEKIEKLKWENKSEVYTVRNRGRMVNVRNRYIAPNRRNIQTTPNHNNRLNRGDQITVTWEESNPDGFEYKKINKIGLGKKLFVIASCTGAGGKLEIELHENLQEETEAIYENPIKFLIGQDEKTKIEFTITPDKFQYEQEITFRNKI
jgi:hypothetical protein